MTIRLRPFILLMLIITLLYTMNVAPVVILITQYKDVWNYSIEYIMHFKDKEPLVFMCLPVIAVYLMLRPS